MNPKAKLQVVTSFSGEGRTGTSLADLDKAVRTLGLSATRLESEDGTRVLVAQFGELLAASHRPGNSLEIRDSSKVEASPSSLVVFLSGLGLEDAAAVRSALSEVEHGGAIDLIGIPTSREQDSNSTRSLESQNGLTDVCEIVIRGTAGGQTSFRVCQLAEHRRSPERRHSLKPGPTRIKEGPGYLADREKWFKSRGGN